MSKKLKVKKPMSLAAKMAEDFQPILEKQMEDQRRKQFYVALMLVLPNISPYEMDEIEPVLVRHLGKQTVKFATEKAS